MSRTRTNSCLRPLAALALLGAPAAAEDTESIEALLDQSVVGTASTSAQAASTAPATSVTFTAEDLERYGIRTIAEAIDFLGLGVMTSDPLGPPDVGSRGVILARDDGKHFLLLVNGHAMNDPLFGAARFDQGAGIPMDVVDRVEVILGPGSVLYGSNAMMGVVNVITKSADRYEGGHVLADFEPGRSWNAGAGTGFTVPVGKLDLGVVAAVEHFGRFGPDLEFDERTYPTSIGIGDLRFRRGGPSDNLYGGRLESAYFVDATSATLGLHLGEVDFLAQGSIYRRGVPYSTIGVDVDFDDPDAEVVDRAIRFDLQHHVNASSLVSLGSRVYADGFDYLQQVNRDALFGCFRGDIETCTYRDVGVAQWAGVEERLGLNWLDDGTLVTMLGLDARYRRVSTKQDAVDFDTGEPFAPTAGRIPGDHGVIVSPYVEQTWSPASSVNLNGGARVDLDDRVSSAVVSPRAAVALRPAQGTTVRGIYSQAFRAPTWAETDLANYRVAPSSDVKPEKVRSVEASVEQRFGTQRVMFGAFRSSWTNMIEPSVLPADDLADLQRRGVLPITATNLRYYHNVSAITNYGWNGAFAGSVSRGRVTYGVNATAAYTRREARGRSTPMALAPTLFGNARVAYAPGGYVPAPAFAVRYLGARLTDRGTTDVNAPRVAEALAELRLAVTGKIAGGLGYRATGTYTTAAHGPYVAGPPVSTPEPDFALARAPIDRFRVLVGLRYDFLDGADAAGEEP